MTESVLYAAQLFQSIQADSLRLFLGREARQLTVTAQFRHLNRRTAISNSFFVFPVT